jgi:hypothetical protein
VQKITGENNTKKCSPNKYFKNAEQLKAEGIKQNNMEEFLTAISNHPLTSFMVFMCVWTLIETIKKK